MTGTHSFPTIPMSARRSTTESFGCPPEPDSASNPGHLAWREVTSAGAVNYEADTVRPPAPGQSGQFVTRITDTHLPYGGGWTIDVAPEHDGTLVTITERGEVYNPLFRFVSRFVLGHTASIDGYLRALGRHFGETLAPGDAPPAHTTSVSGHG